MNSIGCPFKVGDRIHELDVKLSFHATNPFLDKSEPIDRLDLTKPDATVTAITEAGFEYIYDCPVPIGRAAWDSHTEGGECFPAGYSFWRKIS